MHRHTYTATWFTLCYGWRVGIVHTNVDVTASAVNAPAESASRPTGDLKLSKQKPLIIYYLRLVQLRPPIRCLKTQNTHFPHENGTYPEERL